MNSKEQTSESFYDIRVNSKLDLRSWYRLSSPRRSAFPAQIEPTCSKFTGTEATLILDTHGWEIIAEPKRRDSVVESSRQAVTDEKVRAAHAGNFLDCVRSRQAPVENLQIGHHVSSVAHLRNLALRSRSRIEWDAETHRSR